MVEITELSEEEYHEKITEISKEGIREICVTDEGEVVKNYGKVAYRFEPVKEFAEAYPLSVLEHARCNSWWDDSHDLFGHYRPSEAVKSIITRLVRQDVEVRTKELLEGDWDAIQRKKEVREITEFKTVLNEN